MAPASSPAASGSAASGSSRHHGDDDRDEDEQRDAAEHEVRRSLLVKVVTGARRVAAASTEEHPRPRAVAHRGIFAGGMVEVNEKRAVSAEDSVYVSPPQTIGHKSLRTSTDLEP